MVQTCAGYSCTAPTALRSTLPQLNQDQGPTDELCCAYRSGATCGDADGPTLSAARQLACSGGGPITVDLTTPIGNESPAGAQTKCCTTTSLSCTGYSNCPQYTAVGSTPATGPTLSIDLCCAYRSDATCGDVNGLAVSGTDALTCFGGKTNSAGASTPIGNKSPTQAQDTCCTTTVTTYPAAATCGDVDGSTSTADPLVCSSGSLVWSPKTVTIDGKTPSQAQTECCTTLTTSCQGYTCTSGVLKAGPPTIPGTVTLEDAMCCNTCASITCAAPTDTKIITPWPKVAPSADECCGYPTGATCGNVDGLGTGTAAFTCTTGPIPASPTTPLAGVVASAASSKCCLTVYPADATCADIYGTKQAGGTSYNCLSATLNKKPDATTVTTTIDGKDPSAASKECCTTSCQGHTCTGTAALTPKPTYPGIVTLTDAMCCDICVSITCPGVTEKVAGPWPSGTTAAEGVCCTYPAEATCDDVDGRESTAAEQFGCTSGALISSPESKPLGLLRDAQSTCCS